MDDEFMYFTSTGNWSDIDDLEELNEEKSKARSSGEKWQGIAYLIVVGTLFAFVLWNSLNPMLLIVIGAIAFTIFRYMSSSLNDKYKLPYSKILSLEIKSSGATLVFLDFNNNEATQEINQLNQKGCLLFARIADNHQLSPKITKASVSENREI